jgi:glycerophosphoryl diester phosphodiesterase
VELIAHRGASDDAPENTLAAVNLAWRQQADAVEVDVQLSKDRELVVIHDDDTRRTGGVDGKVSKQTFSRLRALDVGRWKGNQWAGERIPSLEEVLATIPDGSRLFVEFKCGPEGVRVFRQTLDLSGRAPKQIVAISFSLDLVRRLNVGMPALEVCWICKFRRNWNTRRWSPAADELISTLTGVGLDGVDLDARGPIDALLVRKLKDAGLKVYVWTVDSPVQARRLVKAGVDGITTNRPGWLREKLK